MRLATDASDHGLDGVLSGIVVASLNLSCNLDGIKDPLRFGNQEGEQAEFQWGEINRRSS